MKKKMIEKTLETYTHQMELLRTVIPLVVLIIQVIILIELLD